MKMTTNLPNIDLHTHTVYSDGGSCIEDMIRQGETNGLKIMAITDHFHMIGAERFTNYGREISEKSKGASMRVLVGLEIHPTTDFTLPFIDKKAWGIDLVLADPLGGGTDALGGLGKRGVLEHFAATYTVICEDPGVDIIAHPLNLGRFGQFRSFSDIDTWLVELLIEETRKAGKYLEVMSGMSWWFPKATVGDFAREYTAFIKHALDEGVKFSIGSDAHCVHGVGNVFWSHRVLEEAGATEEDVVRIGGLG
jgi:putative hydrolase